MIDIKLDHEEVNRAMMTMITKYNRAATTFRDHYTIAVANHDYLFHFATLNRSLNVYSTLVSNLIKMTHIAFIAPSYLN